MLDKLTNKTLYNIIRLRGKTAEDTLEDHKTDTRNKRQINQGILYWNKTNNTDKKEVEHQQNQESQEGKEEINT